MTIRYHLDENMPSAVAAGLRKRERDVTDSAVAGLLEATDQQQLDFSTEQGRVIVTRDHDFLTMAAMSDGHFGIVYWAEKSHFGQLILDLDDLCFERTAEEMRGRILYL